MVPLFTSLYTCVELRLSRLRTFSKVTGEGCSRARNQTKLPQNAAQVVPQPVLLYCFHSAFLNILFS